MNKPQVIRMGALLSLYSLLFYFIFRLAIGFDYSCFYLGAKTLFQGDNPYQTLFAHFFPTVKKISLNVNPPIVLMAFIPFSMLSYSTSLIVWSVISLVIGIVTATVTFSIAFTPAFLKQYRVTLYILYFAFYPTLANLTIGQLGTFIAFFIMVGYYFYLKKRDVIAGLMWGIIIGMKFFPGLLFFYALKQRRYKVMAIMFLTLVTITIIPWMIYGSRIYSNYFYMLSHLDWYGDNWNASINCFLFRIFLNGHNLLVVKLLFMVFFIVGLIWYLKKIDNRSNHLSFSLTLVMMLIMSPFGWMYYFPLLILPLCLTWSEAATQLTDKKWVFAWLTCLFLINFPIDYLRVKHMNTLLEKLTLHSFYFYGLCLLAYLLTRQMGRAEQRNSAPTHDNLHLPIHCILAFGIVILSLSFILRLLR